MKTLIVAQLYLVLNTAYQSTVCPRSLGSIYIVKILYY